jgi:hypothetical protein
MLSRFANRATRQLMTVARRRGHDHAQTQLHPTSPHYCDFGDGPNQVVPSHIFMRYPVVKLPPLPAHLRYKTRFEFNDGTQSFSPRPTGLKIGMRAGFDLEHVFNEIKKRHDRNLAIKTYLTVIFVLFNFELYMWEGFQKPLNSVWQNLRETNLRMIAFGLQWEKSWEEFEDVPYEEVLQVYFNRPYYRKNPYLITMAEHFYVHDILENEEAQEAVKNVMLGTKFRRRSMGLPFEFYPHEVEHVIRKIEAPKSQQFDKSLNFILAKLDL